MGYTNLYSLEEDIEEVESDCLADPDTALALLARLYASPRRESDKLREKRLAAAQRLMEIDLPETMGAMPFDSHDMLHCYTGLPVLAAVLAEQVRLQLLRGKTVVGVGGKFSAGKSRFINTLVGKDLLPEGQGITTAIGTYIVNGPQGSILAYTTAGQLEDLTRDEVKAISHDFWRKYQLGFSHVLHKIVITSPDIRCGIALLDTPGYNSSESTSTMTVADANGYEQASDAYIARKHLMNCDFLVWLVEVGDGCISQSDLEFLASLQLRNNCLVIFNKADQVTDYNLQEILARAPDDLRSAGIPFCGVTAYSSVEGKESFGANHLERFMEGAAEFTSGRMDILTEVEAMRAHLVKSMETQQRGVEKTLNNLEETILEGGDPRNIRSLLALHRELKKKSASLFRQSSQFTKDMRRVKERLNDLFA